MSGPGSWPCAGANLRRTSSWVSPGTAIPFGKTSSAAVYSRLAMRHLLGREPRPDSTRIWGHAASDPLGNPRERELHGPRAFAPLLPRSRRPRSSQAHEPPRRAGRVWLRDRRQGALGCLAAPRLARLLRARTRPPRVEGTEADRSPLRRGEPPR